MKVVEIKDFKRESKKQEFKEKINMKIQNGKEWFIRHKETIIVLAPVVAGCGTTAFKVVGKQINLRKQENLKTCIVMIVHLGITGDYVES